MIRFSCPQCGERMADRMHCTPCGGSGEGAIPEALCGACSGQGEVLTAPYCPTCDTDDSGDLPPDWGEQ
ncbi:hypothetical protein [uncultured Paraglaciecola sp.]|uniref:hypothetical protein n=1 Tax=uncultured Paraglaciecola sp. TaxID=1765024 RepID=UPI0026311A0F|nr:hypothetical protein [uncultured Paraglaciecola sp.]